MYRYANELLIGTKGDSSKADSFVRKNDTGEALRFQPFPRAFPIQLNKTIYLTQTNRYNRTNKPKSWQIAEGQTPQTRRKTQAQGAVRTQVYDPKHKSTTRHKNVREKAQTWVRNTPRITIHENRLASLVRIPHKNITSTHTLEDHKLHVT